jgi:hypothetical protein
VIFPAGTALVAATGKFIHGGPGSRLRRFYARAALLVASFDVGRVPFLFVRVAGFIALGHGGDLRFAISHPFIHSRRSRF